MLACIPESTTDAAHVPVDFEQRLGASRKRVYNHIFRMLGNPSDSEDIAQETLVRAWTHFASFDTTRSFDAWVLRIAHNLCIEYLRHRKHHPVLSLEALAEDGPDPHMTYKELADSSNDPLARLMAREINERLLESIQTLSQAHRQCISLLDAECPYEEIARILNCPLGTVRSRIRRARTCLRKQVTR